MTPPALSRLKMKPEQITLPADAGFFPASAYIDIFQLHAAIDWRGDRLGTTVHFQLSW